MQAYATYTGTRRNRDAMRAHGWRFIVTPDTYIRNGRSRPRWTDGTPAPFGLDNGAWGAYCRGEPWDEALFGQQYKKVGRFADWTVVPDVVGDGEASLRRSKEWLPRLGGRVLLPVQDGMSVEDVRPLVGGRVGVFVGGTTAWKLATLSAWGKLAKAAGCWLHVGRVNSVRRIGACNGVGAHSFDGTSVTRFSCNINRLDAATRQGGLFSFPAPWALT